MSQTELYVEALWTDDTIFSNTVKLQLPRKHFVHHPQDGIVYCERALRSLINPNCYTPVIPSLHESEILALVSSIWPRVDEQ